MAGHQQSRNMYNLFLAVPDVSGGACRLDEHRCRAWWEMHKHHLRVGDAAVRYLKKQAPRNFVSGALGPPSALPPPRHCALSVALRVCT